MCGGTVKKVIGVGIVGCGQIAQIAHLPLLNELPTFEIRAVCDLSQKILTHVSKRFSVASTYTDYHDLLKQKDIDVVLVSTTDHAEIAIDAMNAGKHVFCEKPMAFNLTQCDAMIEAAKRNHVKLMVGYMKRFDPAVQFAIPLIKETTGIRFIRVHDLAGDFQINNEIYDLACNDDVPASVMEQVHAKEKQAELLALGESYQDCLDGYNLLLGLCTHDACVLHELFGSPTKISKAILFADTCSVGILEYGDDIRCVWESGLMVQRPSWDEHIQVYGENRSLQIKFPFPYLKNAETYVNVDEMERGVSTLKQFRVSFDEAYKREWRHFYECITEDKQPLTSGQQGRRDIAFLIEFVKASKSSQEGG
jgi:predicted dehydrogenase